MRKVLFLGCMSLVAVAGLGGLFARAGTKSEPVSVWEAAQSDVVVRNVDLEILVGGRPLDEYYARGRSYVEAIQGAEYEIRIRNPFSFRVAVALSVDGLNTIDARHSTASKWVIEPYGTISIDGWQMSSERARRFYFTSGRILTGPSWGRLQILESFPQFSSRTSSAAGPDHSAPPPRRKYEERSERQSNSTAPESSAGVEQPGDLASKDRLSRDDDATATGIGRSVHNEFSG